VAAFGESQPIDTQPKGVYLNGSVLKAISDEAKDDEKRASV
jgi:hypothetical protein